MKNMGSSNNDGTSEKATSMSDDYHRTTEVESRDFQARCVGFRFVTHA